MDVSNLPLGSQGIILGTIAVPEPATMILGGVALVGGLATIRRRRALRRRKTPSKADKS